MVAVADEGFEGVRRAASEIWLFVELAHGVDQAGVVPHSVGMGLDGFSAG